MGIGSISNKTSSSISGSHTRYTGLASGLDVDELVEGMTIGTQTKIQKQYQQKQLLSWKQDAYQSVSSKLIEFSRKYMSYGSSSNLMGTNFFSKTNVTAMGDNSKYISVSGSSSITDQLSILAVKKLAKNASSVSKNAVSDATLSSGEFALEGDVISDKLAGQGLYIKRGNAQFAVSFNPNLDYSTPEKAVESINKCLEDVDIGKNQNLGDKIQASVFTSSSGEKHIEFKLAAGNENDSNTIQISGGTEDALSTLGFSEGDSITSLSPSIRGTKDLSVGGALQNKKSFIDTVSGKSMTINYNGVSKSIKMPEKLEDLDDYTNGNSSATMEEKFQNYLQKQIDDNFGKNRIKVNINNQGTDADGNVISKMELQTIKADTFDPADPTNPAGFDTTSILKVASGDSGLLGRNGAFQMEYGESNRLNLSTTLEKSGLLNKTNYPDYGDGKKLGFKINGVIIDKTVDGKDFDEETTMSEIINAINQSDAKVKVSYLETSDKFSIASTEPGASGNVKIEAYNESSDGSTDTFDMGAMIFGDTTGSDYVVTKGEDAVIVVDYDGNGGQDPVTLTRGSNTFNIDGLSVTVNNTFDAVDATTGAVDPKQQVTFSAKADVDKITDTIKTMVEDYNAIIELSNKMVSEKRNRDYPPLTDEQREQMSDKDIERWEEKAKAGMLFNDADLRSFTTKIRPIFSSNSTMIQAMKEIGITTSSSREDNGKLVLDESKLRAALEDRPEDVKELFTKAADTVIDPDTGKTVKVGGSGGVMSQLKEIFDTYAATEGATKGVFVEKAGSPYSPLSMLTNSIYKQTKEIDNYIKDLTKKLQVEQTRYYNKFTQLEKLTQQMNSQSSWLTSQFAGQ